MRAGVSVLLLVALAGLESVLSASLEAVGGQDLLDETDEISDLQKRDDITLEVAGAEEGESLEDGNFMEATRDEIEEMTQEEETEVAHMTREEDTDEGESLEDEAFMEATRDEIEVHSEMTQEEETEVAHMTREGDTDDEEAAAEVDAAAESLETMEEESKESEEHVEVEEIKDLDEDSEDASQEEGALEE
ncbi:ATP-dependent RNA helicase DRS1-like isoform X2 [Colossoma macropomum]|uniref:ATP-dependent RNA helicase DRS1-like isoform X2 n=1 Tax=Colossoma macropomum TaxID=42526 RepID=UPI00186488F3|nr:ATP-dependent RNA helicase DRS1-like isoform X2 [Colossoma macropomum]